MEEKENVRKLENQTVFNKKKRIYKKWWFWLIVIIVIFIIIGSSSNTNDNSKDKSTITTFLANTNGKEFYSILCDVAGVEKNDGVSTGDSIVYSSSDEKYGIELETNKNNEINWISIYTLLKDKNDYENFFIAISRLEYEGCDKATIFNWIHDNLGNEATTKVGNANFKLYNGTSGTPILEVYTDGNEEFQKTQLKKVSN